MSNQYNYQSQQYPSDTGEQYKHPPPTYPPPTYPSAPPNYTQQPYNTQYGQQPYNTQYGQQPQPSGFIMPESTTYGISNMPEETAGNRWAGFSDKDIRRAFIRKVYAILTVQLVVTFGLTALCILNSSIKYWIQHNIWVYIVAYVTFLCVYITLICCEGPRRNYPCNFILLGIFTLSFSYMVAMIASFHDIYSVLIAAGITAVCCLTVSILSYWTKFDFTRFGWALFIAGIGLSLMGLVILILSFTSTNIKVLWIVYAGIGTVLFMLYLAYDTQLVCGGGRKYELSPEEYILGALILYVDIVQIFLFILQLVSAAKN